MNSLRKLAVLSTYNKILAFVVIIFLFNLLIPKDVVAQACSSITCSQNCSWRNCPPGCNNNPSCGCQYICDGPEWTCGCADWGFGCSCPDMSCIYVSGSCNLPPSPTPTNLPSATPTDTPPDPDTCWCGNLDIPGDCAIREITVCNASYGGCDCTGGTPDPTPTPPQGTVSGRVSCGSTGYNVQNARITVFDSNSPSNLVAQVRSNMVYGNDPIDNYTASFSPVAPAAHFAVRAGATPLVNNFPFITAGSENFCNIPPGPLVQHESCRFEVVENTSVGGFDFVSNVAVSDLGQSCHFSLSTGEPASTFVWNTSPDIYTHILRVNYEDNTDPEWVSDNDYWLYVPIRPDGTSTIGSCIENICSVTLDDTTLSNIGGNPFQPGNYLGWSVQAVDADGARHCQIEGGAFNCPTSSCSVSLADQSISQGQSSTLTASIIDVSPVGNTMTGLTYASSDDDATFDPVSPDLSVSSWTTLSVTSTMPIGTYSNILSVNGTTSSGAVCSDTATLIVTDPPWWQVYGGSLWANLGGITSNIPTGYTDYPFMPLITGGNTILTTGVAAATGSVPDNFSESNFRASGVTPVNLSGYSFATYHQRLGSPTDDNATEDLADCDTFRDTDYEVCYYDSNFIVGSSGPIDLEERRVILMVDGDLYIEDQINLTKGIGFFMTIVSGDIYISETIGDDPPVVDPHLEGIYMAFDDVVFNTGGSGDDLQIRLRGSVVALDRVTAVDHRGIAMRRNLADNSVGPAEIFEFAPDLTLRFPRFLSPRQISWKEIAP